MSIGLVVVIVLAAIAVGAGIWFAVTFTVRQALTANGGSTGTAVAGTTRARRQVAPVAALAPEVPDRRDDLAVETGLTATDLLSVRVEDLSIIATAMRRLREQPPTQLAGLPVTKAEDLTRGTDKLPPTDGLRYTLTGARVIVRPSGTEPKLKCYLEVVVPVASHTALPAAHTRANALLTAIKQDLSTAAGI